MSLGCPGNLATMHCFPEATYAPSSSAGKPDKLGSDEDFMNLSNSGAADKCHKAFKKARPSLNYAMVMFDQNWEAIKGKGDQAVVAIKGQINRAAILLLIQNPAITHQSRGVELRKNLKTILGATTQLEGDHLLPETKQAVENVIGVDASVDGEGEPGTREKPTSKRRKASQHEDVDVTDVEKPSKPVKKGKTASKQG